MLFTKDVYENVIEEFSNNRQTVVKRLIYEMKAAGHRFPVRGCLLGCRGFAGMLLVYA